MRFVFLVCFFVVVGVVFLLLLSLLLNLFWPCFLQLNDPKRRLRKTGDLWKPSGKKILLRTEFLLLYVNVNHRI